MSVRAGRVLVLAALFAAGTSVKLNDFVGGSVTGGGGISGGSSGGGGIGGVDYYQNTNQGTGSVSGATGSSGGGSSLAQNIPGVPGQDYPTLTSPLNTGFSCRNQQLPGYYADTAPEVGCQVFHICEQDGRQHSFLCPVGTLFSQQFLVCDWWYNVDCSLAGQFYQLNALIGQAGASFGGNSGGNFGRSLGGNFGGGNDGGISGNVQPPTEEYQASGK